MALWVLADLPAGEESQSHLSSLPWECGQEEALPQRARRGSALVAGDVCGSPFL